MVEMYVVGDGIDGAVGVHKVWIFRLRWVAIVGGVAAGVGGCGGTHSSPSAGGPSVRSGSGGWSRADLKPVSQPAFVDGRFLLYAHTNGGLHLVALDARSGATAWSVDASPAAVAPGQPATFAVVGTEVIAFRETSGQIAELIARNTASGRELWHSQPGLFTTYPDVCPANTSMLCVTGVYKSLAQSGQLLEFGERTGAELHSIVLPSSTTGARSLGS